jgi:hypothetical protein
LWIGPSLGPVERACLRSVLRQGHRLSLYCYEKPAGVPPGIVLRDAAQILPRSSIIRHHSGSVSLFSNRFRYELQRRALGTWLDCDAYLVRPLDGTSDYLIGEYEPGRVSTGILRLPQDSPLLEPLLAIFEQKTVMPWLPWRAKAAAHWRLLTTGRVDVAKLPWGSAGPVALTYLTHAHGLADLAVPKDVFYPVPWQEADWILRPDRSLEDVLTPQTVSVHFWNERIKAFKHRPAPRGSVLARLHEEGGA